MWRAFINWLKSLYYSCFPWLAPAREVEPLLVPDPEPAPAPIAVVAEAPDSTHVIHKKLEPAKLTAEESALVLHFAQKGENEFINNLSQEKRSLAYNLIRSFTNYHVNKIDHAITKLVKLNHNANRLEASWRRMRPDFTSGYFSEYDITPTCQEFKSKQIDINDKHKTLQNALLDVVMSCVRICKNMLRLQLSRHRMNEAERTRTPTQEESLRTIHLQESRMNAKTLEIVKKFNESCDEEAVDNPPRRRRRFGKR